MKSEFEDKLMTQKPSSQLTLWLDALCSRLFSGMSLDGLRNISAGSESKISLQSRKIKPRKKDIAAKKILPKG
jgi:hypothetical protein